MCFKDCSVNTHTVYLEGPFTGELHPDQNLGVASRQLEQEGLCEGRE